jgi:hypothetical protein
MRCTRALACTWWPGPEVTGPAGEHALGPGAAAVYAAITARFHHGSSELIPCPTRPVDGGAEDAAVWDAGWLDAGKSSDLVKVRLGWHSGTLAVSCVRALGVPCDFGLSGAAMLGGGGAAAGGQHLRRPCAKPRWWRSGDHRRSERAGDDCLG